MNQYLRFFIRKPLLPFAFLATILILVMCEEETPEPRDYPRLKGAQVSNISNEGATFTANLYAKGNSPIVEHGFLWGRSKSLDIEFNERIFLGPLDKEGSFSAEITTALDEGEEYFVRPFARIADKSIYGPETRFKSLGSIGPVITGFLPESAGWGDTLKIFGKNFSWARNDVFLNDKGLSVLEFSDTVIYALIEPTIKAIENNLSVSVAGNTTTYIPRKFRLIPPTIQDFSPKQVYWGDTLVIKGTYLSYIKTTGSFVKLGSINCQLIPYSVSDTLVKIKIPHELSSESNQLNLNVNGIILAASSPLTLLPPYFSFAPTEGTWGNIITLKGRFHPVASRNTITIGGNAVTISSFNKDSIKVSVPIYAGNYKNAVTLKASPFTITSPDSFRLYKPVINSIFPLSGRSNGKVTIRGRYLFCAYGVSTVVRLGGVNMSMYSYSDSLLVCTLPYFSENISSPISVSVGNQVAHSAEVFSIRNPLITDFNPKNGTFNDEITIRGKYLKPIDGTSSPSVYFGNNAATVTDFNDSIIVAKLPLSADSIPVNLRVYTEGLSVYSNEKFTLTPPSIINITPSTFTAAGVDVVINGTGFNPEILKNKAYWDIYPLTIKAVTSSQMIVTLPEVMARNDSRINIVVGGYKRSSPVVSNDVSSKWNKVADLPKNVQWAVPNNNSYRSVSFSLNGKGYFMDYYGSMFSFDPLIGSLQNVTGSVKTFAYQTGLATVVFRDTALVMGHNLGLHRYDIVSRSWVSQGVSSPILGNNFYGVFFSLNDKLYYGIANSDYGSYSYGTLNRTFWEFDRSTKSWKPKQSLPAITTKPPVAYFSMNNKGYVLFTDNIFCEYDPSSDTWTQLQSYPVNSNYFGRVAMVINNKAYVGLGTYSGSFTDQFYVYDRGSNTWTLFDRIPYGARYNSGSFVLNNKGYVIGGYIPSPNSLLKDVMEFDPAF